MRFHLSTAILAFLHLALCAPSADVTGVNISDVLDIRTTEPAPVPEPTNVVPAGSSSFMVTIFEAFLPFEDGFSRTMFNVTLMHPNLDQRWNVTCMALTKGELCNPNNYTRCLDVPGVGNEDEELWFKFGQNLSRVDIKRQWRYQNMWLTATASEPATWSESVNDGNVTVSAWGKFYERPNGWIFPWRTVVG